MRERLAIIFIILFLSGCDASPGIDRLSGSPETVTESETERPAVPPIPDDIGVLKELPAELAYLKDPAMNYGRYQFEEHIFDFLETITEEEESELREVAAAYVENDHESLVNRFLDEFNMTEHPRAAELYFLFLVIDLGDLWPANDSAKGN